MRKLGTGVAAALLLTTVAWAAKAPKCAAEKAALEQAKADDAAATQAWKSAFAKAKALDARLEELNEAVKRAAAAVNAAQGALDQAETATTECHASNGYTLACKAAEQAEFAASRRLGKARDAWNAAEGEMVRAFTESTKAEEAEEAAYKKMDAADKRYEAALDAYYRCLRGKKWA